MKTRVRNWLFLFKKRGKLQLISGIAFRSIIRQICISLINSEILYLSLLLIYIIFSKYIRVHVHLCVYLSELFGFFSIWFLLRRLQQHGIRLSRIVPRILVVVRAQIYDGAWISMKVDSWHNRVTKITHELWS